VSGALHIGPAGWSYKDWEGVVYSREAQKDPLGYLMQLFDVIEINSTFYRPPAPRVSTRWAMKAEASPGFRFTAKLYRLFTHESPREWTSRDVTHTKAGLDPLFERGVLGMVLVQFPWFFKATKANAKHLERIRHTFDDWPLALEVRHASWTRPEALEIIGGFGFTFCGIDQPHAKTSIDLAETPSISRKVGSPFGYIRLHGLNAKAWFSKTATRDEKYDYLYDPSELDRITKIVESVRKTHEHTWVIANNHFAGKAVVNALELADRLGRGRGLVPETLVRTYRRLEAVVR